MRGVFEPGSGSRGHAAPAAGESAASQSPPWRGSLLPSLRRPSPGPVPSPPAGALASGGRLLSSRGPGRGTAGWVPAERWGWSRSPGRQGREGWSRRRRQDTSRCHAGGRGWERNRGAGTAWRTATAGRGRGVRPKCAPRCGDVSLRWRPAGHPKAAAGSASGGAGAVLPGFPGRPSRGSLNVGCVWGTGKRGGAARSTSARRRGRAGSAGFCVPGSPA